MSDSRQADFDWHKRGVWIVIDPENDPLHETTESTPWGARGILLRRLNLRWSECDNAGYYIQEFRRAK